MSTGPTNVGDSDFFCLSDRVGRCSSFLQHPHFPPAAFRSRFPINPVHRSAFPRSDLAETFPGCLQWWGCLPATTSADALAASRHEECPLMQESQRRAHIASGTSAGTAEEPVGTSRNWLTSWPGYLDNTSISPVSPSSHRCELWTRSKDASLFR